MSKVNRTSPDKERMRDHPFFTPEKMFLTRKLQDSNRFAGDVPDMPGDEKSYQALNWGRAFKNIGFLTS